MLVDGFKCAADLYKEDQEAYHILSTTNAHAHASGNEGISIMPYKGFPVLGHDEGTGLLNQVRWNSGDRAAVEGDIGEVERWYGAARAWVEIVRRGENEYWSQLEPGKVLSMWFFLISPFYLFGGSGDLRIMANRNPSFRQLARYAWAIGFYG